MAALAVLTSLRGIDAPTPTWLPIVQAVAFHHRPSKMRGAGFWITGAVHVASALVCVREVDGMVVVEIADDGVGGADPAHGTGLVGISERIDSIEGRLEVRSTLGGPTGVRAELPCAS